MEDDNDFYTVIAFDPGGTTGWAVMSTFREVMGPPPFERWLAETPVWSVEIARGTSGAREAAQLEWKQQQANAGGFRLLENIAHFETGEFHGDEDDQTDALLELVDAWPVSTPIVGEKFILRTFRSDEALLSPVRIYAKVEYGLRRRGIPARNPRSVKRKVIPQSPSLALGGVTDERLRSWNGGRLFNATRGLPHGRDAARHDLTFLRREREARARGKSHELWPGVVRF